MFILLSLLLIMAAWSMCLPACLSEAPLSRTWPAATDLSLPDENALGPFCGEVITEASALCFVNLPTVGLEAHPDTAARSWRRLCAHAD